ncbi:MAG: hypothetical protein PHS92_04195 [Candidatus Gracilibacteria bacterium]|nr:hypothetical protein [Candidatus Gracilibacteria bacterium]
MINKKYIVMALALTAISFSAFAETGATATGSTSDSAVSAVNDADPLSQDAGIEADADSVSGESQTPAQALAPKGGVSNYAEIACDKEYFTQNACNQCFDGGKKIVGEKITNLTDGWTNPNTGEQVIYKDEQTMPELVNLGGNGTKWISNPEDSSKFWKFSDEIVWTDSKTGSGKQEFLLEGGKTVNFIEGGLGATYVMDSTDIKEGEIAGLLKMPITYHNIDESGKEGTTLNHVECIAYLAGAQAAKAPVPQPKEITKVKTGPELYILLLLAFSIAFGFVKLRKKA